MRGVNLHTRVFIPIVNRLFDSSKPKTVVEIENLHTQGAIETQYVDELDVEVGVADFEEAGLPKSATTAVKILNRLAPVTDPPDRWASVDEARNALKATFGNRLATTLPWADPTGDRALALLCTQGIAAHLLERGADPGTWQVDLRFLSRYAVRPGFLRYGARVVFEGASADKLVPRSITWARGTHTPADAEWEAAKFAFRATVAVSVTIRDHAVRVHFLGSNASVVATRKTLAPTHVVRQLLHPFQFRTPEINAGALVTLIPEWAIFHRLFAFDWAGLSALYADARADYRMLSPVQDLVQRGVSELPGYGWAQDAVDLYEQITTLVGDYLDVTGVASDPSDDPALVVWHHALQHGLPLRAGVPPIGSHAQLTDLLSQMIFVGSAMHQQVGGFLGDYLSRPDFLSPTIVDGPDVHAMWPSRNTMYQGCMLGVLTNLPMPDLTEDFSPLVPPSAGQVVQRWCKGLEGLSATIAERNKLRVQPLLTFSPDHLDISVSI